jgi:hypothetical protein
MTMLEAVEAEDMEATEAVEFSQLQRPDHSVHGRGHCGTHGPA